MSENEKDCRGAYCRICGEDCGPEARFCAEWDEPMPVVLGDEELRMLQDAELPENTPNEDIAAIGDRAFFDGTLSPCGFGDGMVVIRSIVSRNRFTILLRDDGGNSRLVFDGYISRNPNGWIAFTTTPPLDESRLTITGWQHWRLLGCLKIKRFLKKCFRYVSLWWVGRPRYATGRDTTRLSRPSRPVE